MRNQQKPAAGWIGRVLAGHRIDALIGEGGMGVVYRATHLHLGRSVALKVLPPALAADPEFRRRFEREAAIAASLEHPAVVPIYDAGHADGVLYLAMRLVEGDDLGAVLQREGPLDVERLCALLGPLADALDAVHEAGLVHRDVKPGNVLVARPGRNRAGRVYLCDFGIAKGRADAGLTTAGQYIGTLQYSSPEQIQGRWLDGRADQYGLACLAFRVLTGQVPYPRDDTAAVIYAHLAADPPRPGLLRPGLPPAVDAVVARAAAKDPDHRFPSCSAFVAALWSARSARPVPRPAPAPGRPVPPPPSPPPPHGAAPARPSQPHTSQPHTSQPRPLTEPRPSSQPEPDAVPSSDPAGTGRVPAPRDAHAERGPDDASVSVGWTAGGPQEVEYKITRIAADGRRTVVGRTRTTGIIDGAVAADAEIPVYEVVARLGGETSVAARTTALSPPGRPDRHRPDRHRPDRHRPDRHRPDRHRPDRHRPDRHRPDPDPDGFPAVGDLAVSAPGTLVFTWPHGITEAMVVVCADRPPASPDDPAATSWKITNMRYQLDGGLLLPTSVPLPCHVAVAACRRDRGALVVAPGFGPTARATVEPRR